MGGGKTDNNKDKIGQVYTTVRPMQVATRMGAWLDLSVPPTPGGRREDKGNTSRHGETDHKKDKIGQAYTTVRPIQVATKTGMWLDLSILPATDKAGGFSIIWLLAKATDEVLDDRNTEGATNSGLLETNNYYIRYSQARWEEPCLFAQQEVRR